MSSICAISTARRSAGSRGASSAGGYAHAGRMCTDCAWSGSAIRPHTSGCLAFMPAAQGVVKWPSDRPALAALVDEDELPLPEAAVDRVLLVHAIETSQNVGALLREVWRVLAAGGRLLVVVPNRRGGWARIDTTPFGYGHPYSRPQITHLLRETWFTPPGWDEALYVPPIPRKWFLRSAIA